MISSEDLENFENLLHSANVMAYGIMGTDKRPVSEIIQSDMDELNKSGVTAAKLAARMNEITDKAIAALGN
jgi:hypothetical protein